MFQLNPTLHKSRHEKFIHPYMLRGHIHSINAAKIEEGTTLYKFGPDPKFTTEVEFRMEQQILKLDGLKYCRYWCPICGNLLTDGPSGGASVNMCCTICNINFGSLESTEIHYSIPTRLLARRPVSAPDENFIINSLQNSEDYKPYMASVALHLANKYQKYKPTIIVINNFYLGYTELQLNLWCENNFHLCDIGFFDDVRITSPQIIEESKDDPVPTIDMITTIYEICDPNSIDLLESKIDSLIKNYGLSYIPLFDELSNLRSDKFTNTLK